MRFNCGPTSLERWNKRFEAESKWHLKFLFWPRRVGPNDCRWFEYVERKYHPEYLSFIKGGLDNLIDFGSSLGDIGSDIPKWEYRAIKEK